MLLLQHTTAMTAWLFVQTTKSIKFD